MLRTTTLVALLVFGVVIPFLIWGEQTEAWVVVDAQNGRLAGFTTFAWLVGIGLLISDLFIPIPTTVILAGLGILYGPVFGAVFGTAGVVLSATIGFALGRVLGRPLAARFLGAQLDSGERLFKQHGGWVVAASRWLPILSEVVAVVAGVHKMRGIPFLAASICGAVPFAAAFAFVGHLGADAPMVTLGISALFPLVLWFLASHSGLLGKIMSDTQRPN